jgi:hypothetical protein
LICLPAWSRKRIFGYPNNEHVLLERFVKVIRIGFCPVPPWTASAVTHNWDNLHGLIRAAPAAVAVAGTES